MKAETSKRSRSMDSGTDSPSIFSASMFENVGREETVTTENQLKENEYPRYVVLFVLKSQFASTVTPFKETWYGCSPIGVKFARFFFSMCSGTLLRHYGQLLYKLDQNSFAILCQN